MRWTLGLGLLASIAFLAPLTAVIWRAGFETAAFALLVAGSAFLALGFMSVAAETALVDVADQGEPARCRCVEPAAGPHTRVWAVTALVAITALAMLRTGLMRRWLGIGGLVLAGAFLLASISSLVGHGVEGGYSLIGVGLIIIWMLALSAGLWRTASGHSRHVAPSTPPRATTLL